MMSFAIPFRFTLAAFAALALAQPVAKTSGAPNSQPNPYQTIDNFFNLPEGMKMGSTAAIDLDQHEHLWVAQRCGGNSCAGKPDDPILEFDLSGKLLRHFGGGMFVFPHGIGLDKDGNVWVTDGQARDGKGMVVIKFSPDGRVLMTLGKPGVAGDGQQTDAFNQPNDVAIAPNGDIFVSEGHTSTTGSARITKFDKNGKFIMQWGKHGSGPGEFEVPHALCFDSKGRLFVGDRGNSRVQVFDQNGKFIEEFTQFGKPSGIYIDKHDILYVADSESQEVAGARGPYGLHPGWLRGIRLGSIKDGVVTAFIPDTETTGAKEPRPITTAAEGIVADSKGMLYGAEVGKMDIKKYVKQ
jgi:streptogramin lyase